MATSKPKLDMSEMVQASAWDRVANGYANAIAAHLELFAADALSLAKVSANDRVVDVATGPGSLARPAARITRVDALDFSDEMLGALRRYASASELANLTLCRGDGQALPYEDNCFDAGFSMFGLFMFPDRSRGFAELQRVLKPGGRVVVGTWQPQDNLQAFRIMDAALGELMEHSSSDGPPLADPNDLRAELEAAGFEDIEVKPSVHVLSCPSTSAMWEELERAHVALGIARAQLTPTQYDALSERICLRLQEQLGSGPQKLEMRAWLGFGRTPSVNDG